jgi:acetyl-CoA C-acetyltransferase
MPQPVLVAGARTPIGKLLGSLAALPAPTLRQQAVLSGLAAIAQAAQQVQLGYSRVVAAGGMESMSGAPHLSRGTRRGLRYGAGAPLEDALDSDALVCGFDDLSMGAATDKYQARQRRDQPRGPGRVRRRVAGPGGGGGQGGPARRGDRHCNRGRLSDGACAVVVMDKEEAQRRGPPWLAEIGGYGTVAGSDPSLLLQPANAIRDALRRDAAGRDDAVRVGYLDLIEINVAFAGVALASLRDLGVAKGRVNVNGGAIALGHPVGMAAPA